MKKIAILTVSDSRTLDSDTSGKLIAMKMANAGLSVVDRVIVNDDIVNIQTAYLQLEQQAIDIIITNGGTGVAQRDVFCVHFPVTAGFNYRNQLTYCLPGSQNACQTALNKLILPEYEHLLFESSSQRKEVHHHAH